MGCGHSKINIYPRKSKNKTSSKKTVTSEKAESEEEEAGENGEIENYENIDDCDAKRTIKVKPITGPILAQSEISSSQQDFFKMLDEKIENGPDYDPEGQAEKAAEFERLNSLLKDWETASLNSSSHPTTPQRKPKPWVSENLQVEAMIAVDIDAGGRRLHERDYISLIPQSVIHQSYGVTQVGYKDINYKNTNYSSHSPSRQISYPSAMQYQAISPMAPMYSNHVYQPPPPQLRQYSSYNQHGVPIKSYIDSSSASMHKNLYGEQSAYSVTGHSLYGPAPMDLVDSNSLLCNGSELLQQQLYNQFQYQQQQHQPQHRDVVREQVLAVQEPQHHPSPSTGYRLGPRGYPKNVVPSVPLIMQNPQHHDANVLSNVQYELT